MEKTYFQQVRLLKVAIQRCSSSQSCCKVLEKTREVLFFSIWIFFQEHLRSTGLQGKGDDISLTPHYHFHLLHRHLDINWVITAESSPLHITSSQTRTGNLWFPRASRSFLFPMESLCICIHAYLLSNCGISTVTFVYVYTCISTVELWNFYSKVCVCVYMHIYCRTVEFLQ